MAILDVYLYGAPILRKKTNPVTDLPSDFERILNDMFETMYDDDGIGLAANQVGLDMKFFIADFGLRDKSLGREVFLNPEIISASGAVEDEEGCLSLPNIRERVVRAEVITLRYENLARQVKEIELRDFLARVVQHEVDHLNGIFFTDRITPLRRSFLKSKLRHLAKQASLGLHAKDIK